MDEDIRTGLITLVMGAAIYGCSIAAGAGISHFVHNVRFVNLGDQRYGVGRHDGKTTVGAMGFTGGYRLTDHNGDGIIDSKTMYFSVPKRPLIIHEEDPTEEDQELFTLAVSRYDSQMKRNQEAETSSQR